MAVYLCKRKPGALSNPYLIHLFSTSQNDNNENNNNNGFSSSQQSSLNSYFSDVKASRKKQSRLQQQQSATGSPFFRAAPSESASLEEFRKNLAEFRQLSAVPPSPGPNPSSSFQEICKRDANSDLKPGGSDVKASRKKPSQLQQQQNATGSPFFRAAPSKSASLEEFRKNLAEFRQRSTVPPSPGPNHSSSFQEIYKRDANSDWKPRGKVSFEAIRESLRKMRSFESNNNNDSSSEQSSHNSYSSDLKASRKKPSQLQQNQNAAGSPFFRAAPSESASLEEIRKNLAELRQHSSVPPHPGTKPFVLVSRNLRKIRKQRSET
ncbi:hypothetical protein Patl1_15252 [Pistacia atlantica]|uniref:Uncharacterized protein n=1 Tax=Pistacia atlantica TaxID=434234 RepID=A0ACC1B764_9ROSI|nr:hypothetical protein Patl1_15252 [Pistacia atlantica]